MKKIIGLFLSFMFLIVFAGCDMLTTLTTVSTTTVNKVAAEKVLNEEMSYLSTVLPYAIVSDYKLPDTKNSEVSVSYEIEDVVLENNTIKFISKPNNTNLYLKVTLEYKTVSINKSFMIVMMKDEKGYYEYEAQEVFKQIEEAYDLILPKEVIKNFKIEKLEFENTKINVSVEGLNYEDEVGVYLYDYPSLDKTVSVNITILYKNAVSHTFKRELTVKSVSNLPEIPRIYIDTNNEPILDKENYVDGTFTLQVQDAETLEWKTEYDGLELGIRGRGNSTWTFPKKPYRIKFDSKQSLFGQPKNKSWVLLANHVDQSLIRNYLAYNFANSLENLDFSPCTYFVDLYLNGEYQGNYLLTDQMEVNTGRVEVEKDSKEVDTGYLIELDQRLYETPEGTKGWDWFEVKNMNGKFAYMIKYPKTDEDYFNINQHNYIKTYMESVYTAVSNKSGYEELIDVDSFVDYFIVQDLFKNVDSGFSSVYYHKDKGGKLIAGPVWDFDLSSTNPGHLDDYNRSPEGWYTSRIEKNRIYYYLMQDDNFRAKLKARWLEIRDVEVQNMMDLIDPTVDYIRYSAYKNFQVWNVLGQERWEWYKSPEVYEADTYEQQIELLRDWLNRRIEWLDEEFKNNF